MNLDEAMQGRQAPNNSALDLSLIFGLAGLYGCAKSVTRKFDALDLGCGVGAQLERIASQSKGLLVGIDHSSTSCNTARASLARFGGRAQIVCKEFAELDARNLGAFDFLIANGIIHAVAPTVQRRLLDAIAFSLTPGGVAVIGFHANASFGVSHIEAALAPRGVEYLNDLPAGAFGGHATSQERAYAADAFETDAGRYRYALLGRVGDDASEPNARATHLRWSSRLVHPPVGILYRSGATYYDAALGKSAQITRVEAQAALDELQSGAKNFAQLLSGARARLNRAGVKAQGDIAEVIGAELLRLTWVGLVTPLWKEG